MNVFRSQIYMSGSTPAYRSVGGTTGSPVVVDTMRQALQNVYSVLLAANWSVMSELYANGVILTPSGLPDISYSPATIYLCTVDGVAFYVGTGIPPGAINIGYGATSMDTINNLVSAVTAHTNWNAVYSATATSGTPGLVLTSRTRSGYAGASDPNGVLPWSGSGWVSAALPEYGAGYQMQSQTLANNTALQMNVIESASQFNNVGLEFDFFLFGVPPPTGSLFSGKLVMAQSYSYSLWASQYAFAIWEVNDTVNYAHGAGDPYSTNRNVLYSQLYQDGAWANPVHVMMCGQNRLGLSTTQASLQYYMSLIGSDVVLATGGDLTHPYPLASFFVPRFSVTQQPLKSSNATPVMVESLLGSVRASASPPCRIYGWLPDSFILMDDRKLEEPIAYQGNNYFCFRTGGTDATSQRPKASLYLASGTAAPLSSGSIVTEPGGGIINYGSIAFPQFTSGALANDFVNWYPDPNWPIYQLHADGHIDGAQSFFSVTYSPGPETLSLDPPVILAASHGGTVVEYMLLAWASYLDDPGMLDDYWWYVQRGISYNGSYGSNPHASWNLADLTFTLMAAPTGSFTSALITQNYGGSNITSVYDNSNGIYFENGQYYRESFNVTYSPSGSWYPYLPFLVALEKTSAPGTALEFLLVIKVTPLGGDNYRWEVNHGYGPENWQQGNGSAPSVAQLANTVQAKLILPHNAYP